MSQAEEHEQSESLAERVKEHLGNGMSKQEATDILVALGVDLSEAARFVNEVDDMRKAGLRRKGLGKVVGGILLTALGAGITWGTWVLAGPGGAYVVTWGLIIAGLVYVGVGLLQMLDNAR